MPTMQVPRVFPAAALIAWVLALAACAPAPEPRNLLLISIDTLRADHLGAYGHVRPTSPNLDAFAEEGLLFTRAQATANWTLPSHASLLTGLYPSRHGVRTLKRALGEEVPTLASVLAREGFETGAFVNNLFLAEPFGLSRGFDDYEFVKAVHEPAGAAEGITARALDWLRVRRDRPVFLFLHYNDVHSDYRSLPRYERLLGVRAGRFDGSTQQMLQVNGGKRPIREGDVEQLKRRYDAGIRQLDETLGRFFAVLRDWGWLDETLMVVTSDHGEAFLEHGKLLHDDHYQDTLHVPLVLRGPGVPAGRRVDARVSLVDLLPTVLALLEVAPPREIDGVDLRAIWEGDRADGRAIFSEGGPGHEQDSRLSVVKDGYKLILDPARERRELFHLDRDPGETRELAQDDPETAERLAALVRRLRADRREAPRREGPSEEEERQLRSLGYLR